MKVFACILVIAVTSRFTSPVLFEYVRSHLPYLPVFDMKRSRICYEYLYRPKLMERDFNYLKMKLPAKVDSEFKLPREDCEKLLDLELSESRDFSHFLFGTMPCLKADTALTDIIHHARVPYMWKWTRMMRAVKTHNWKKRMQTEELNQVLYSYWCLFLMPKACEDDLEYLTSSCNEDEEFTPGKKTRILEKWEKTELEKGWKFPWEERCAVNGSP